MASDGLTPTEGRWITLSELATTLSRAEDQSRAATWWELVSAPVDPMSGCPSCGKPIFVSSYNEWACSDPDGARAHGDGPGGGTPL